MDANLLTEAIYVFFGLAIWAQIKHFIADYPLQGPYMLGKFKEKGWVKPLAAHAGVHFLFTAFLTLIWTESPLFAIKMGLLDFVIHFIMDRIKASSKMLGRYKALSAREFPEVMRDAGGGYKINDDTYIVPEGRVRDAKKRLQDNVYFWWALGLDQTVHHLTDITIVFLIIKHVYGV